MAEPILDAESPYIKISRSGSVTRVAADDRAYGAATPYVDRAFDDVDDPNIVTLREIPGRPMPKRLSEEVREMEEAARRRKEVEDVIEDEPAPKPKKARTSRKKKTTAAKDDAEQIALPLKTPKEKPDTMVKQRQVMGLACIVMAIFVRS